LKTAQCGWSQAVEGGEATISVECPESPQSDDSNCTLGLRLDPLELCSPCGLDLPEVCSLLSFFSSIVSSSREISDNPAPMFFRAGGMGAGGGRVDARSITRCDL
jgi:hypothetical protein